MSLDDYLVSTGVDNLIKLVRERKKIEMQEAAAILRVPLSTIKIWAKTLEEEKIIRVEYSLTKEYLVWKGLDSETYKEKKEQIEEKRRETIKKLSGMKKIVDENVEDLERVKEEFIEIRDKTKNSIETLAGDLQEAELLTQKIDNQLLEKKQVLQVMYNEIKKASGALIEIKTILKEQNIADNKYRELKTKMDEVSTKIENKIEEINKIFEEINKIYSVFEEKVKTTDYNKELERLTTELNDLKYAKQELLKLAKSILLESKEIEKKTEQINSQMQQIKQQLQTYKPDEIEQKINALYNKAIQESRELAGPLKEEFFNIKETINKYSNFLYKYQEAINRLESAEDKYQKESAEIMKIIDMLEDARQKYLKDVEEAKNSLGENKQRYEQLLQRAKKIEMILANIDELKQEGQKLSKKLKGLMMETEIIDIALPEDEIDTKKLTKEEDYIPTQLVKKIELTKKEEEEFERKKQELTFLIEKLLREQEESSPS
ncbi:MAG: hypothetical protein N3D10_02705 [Candidatus Micrarchaeota archaeon]|nr:hypothetical protein [Candidatus Micrarchaeota archaeon]